MTLIGPQPRFDAGARGRGLCHLLLLMPLLLLIAGCEAEPPTATPVTRADAPPGEIPATATTGQVAAAAEDGLEAGMVNPGYTEKPDWFVDSFLDIREDVAEAAAVDKRVILYFYQDGCPYCKKLLDINLSRHETVEKMRGRFNVIAINMWGDREVTDFDGAATTEKAFARALRVMFTPTLLFLNERADVVLRVNGYYAPHKFNTALDYAAVHNGSDPDYQQYYAEVAPSPASGRLHTDDASLTARPMRNWTGAAASDRCWCSSSSRTAQPVTSCTGMFCSVRKAGNSWRALTACCSTCGRSSPWRVPTARPAAWPNGPGNWT